MNDLNLTNMKLLHHFCLKHSKIGQICMRGGPFISSHPVAVSWEEKWHPMILRVNCYKYIHTYLVQGGY